MGLVMLTGDLHVEHFALTVIDDLISRLDLIQQRRDLGQCLTARCILWIGANDAPGSGKFVCKFTSKKRVILGGLGNNFGIGLRSVQGAKTTLKRKTSSKAELMKPRQGLRERHIEIRYNCKILLGAGYLKQQKTSERDGEQQQDYGEPVNLCCYGLPERHKNLARVSCTRSRGKPKSRVQRTGHNEQVLFAAMCICNCEIPFRRIHKTLRLPRMQPPM